VISELSWMAEEMPVKVKLILSCSEDTPIFESLKSSMKHEDAFVSVILFFFIASNNKMPKCLKAFSTFFMSGS
jgi:hypothetical protein